MNQDWKKSNDADETSLTVAAACKNLGALQILMKHQYRLSEVTGAADVGFSSLPRRVHRATSNGSTFLMTQDNKDRN
jgi:hypothetical protein